MASFCDRHIKGNKKYMEYNVSIKSLESYFKMSETNDGNSLQMNF